jgi:hypothetical protein
MSDNISPPQGSAQLTLDMALDGRLYDLTEEERTFFKQQTGIQGDDELKAHLFQVQAEAYEVCSHPALLSTGNEIHGTLLWLVLSKKKIQVYPYPCIRLFHFAK